VTVTGEWLVVTVTGEWFVVTVTGEWSATAVAGGWSVAAVTCGSYIVSVVTIPCTMDSNTNNWSSSVVWLFVQRCIDCNFAGTDVRPL
jgi:hypothetical protein